MPQEIVNLCDKTTGLGIGKECPRVVEKSDKAISILFGLFGPQLDGDGALPNIEEAKDLVTPQLRHFCSPGHANFWLHHLVVMHPDEVARLVEKDENADSPQPITGPDSAQAEDPASMAEAPA